MATMAALLPTTSFSVVDSTSQISSCTFHRSVASQRISLSRFGGDGHGSAHVVSGARGLWRRVSLRLERVSSRVNICSEAEQQSSADEVLSTASDLRCTDSANWISSCRELPSGSHSCHGRIRTVRPIFICNCTSRETQDTVGNEDSAKEVDEDSPSAGVAIAVKILQFYKREISPLLPGSCRFVPTCSEYGMLAFKKYGVVKGAILTAWRLSRCNPLGGSGFDPPRWFDEPRPPPY